jgi:hypothetical protein
MLEVYGRAIAKIRGRKAWRARSLTTLLRSWNEILRKVVLDRAYLPLPERGEIS